MDHENSCTNFTEEKPMIITAGSTYLDIDAYACAVAMAELLRLKGENAIAYSTAPCNYSVAPSLTREGQIEKTLPLDVAGNAKYMIVDVSDPEFLKASVPLERVVAVYDHHVGFEDYWKSRIGEDAHIEFLGAAATLVYREWRAAGLEDKMTHETARLLIAAILDNTLNLTSDNTTKEDKAVFRALCERENADASFCAAYFTEVQASVEKDLKNALFGDLKTVRDNAALPQRVAQISAWDAERLLDRLPEIRTWFEDGGGAWMVNVIDIHHRYSCFVCDSEVHQKKLAELFDIAFHSGVARTKTPYLRKEIIKKTRLFD